MSSEWLLRELEDPFEVFPLQSVERLLAEARSDAEDEVGSKAGWWGVSSKYRSVEDEHHLAVVSLLMGAEFVLGQAAITRSVALVRQWRKLSGVGKLTSNARDQILSIGTEVHPASGLGEMILIDAVANYFKHHPEWPEDWSPDKAGKPQRQTIDRVRLLGLEPGDPGRNLRTALGALGVGQAGENSLGTRIQAWRERLAEILRQSRTAPLP